MELPSGENNAAIAVTPYGYVIILGKEVSMVAKEVTIPSPIARKAPREILPPTFIAVDERRFESEIRRIDTTLADERKNREKFEIEVFRRFDKVDSRFEKVDVRFEKVDVKFDKLNDKMDSHFRWMMGFLVGAVLIPIALQYFAK
jgi:hypothetical protein